MTKPFSADLYEQDDGAKNLFIAWLKNKGWDVGVNPDQYGIDLLGTAPDGKRWEIEIEVKHTWVGKTFPFDHVHFPIRKKKFAHNTSIFVMFNHERNTVLTCLGRIVAESPIVSKQTKYTEQEYFIQVPTRSCKIIQISGSQ